MRQYPPNGGLSAHDSVILVISKARYGLVPDLVGRAHAQVRGVNRLRQFGFGHQAGNFDEAMDERGRP